MKTRHFVRVSAVLLGLAGLMWAFKAGAIMATGSQPALSFELGQVLFPFGAIGLYFTSPKPDRLYRTGLASAVLGFLGSLFALLYPLVPGAVIPSEEQFLFPHSYFMLLGGIGGFLGLTLIAIAVWQARERSRRQRAIPMVAALLPIPLLITGAIHFEMPIFLIGITWIALACYIWSLASNLVVVSGIRKAA